MGKYSQLSFDEVIATHFVMESRFSHYPSNSVTIEDMKRESAFEPYSDPQLKGILERWNVFRIIPKKRTTFTTTEIQEMQSMVASKLTDLRANKLTGLRASMNHVEIDDSVGRYMSIIDNRLENLLTKLIIMEDEDA